MPPAAGGRPRAAHTGSSQELTKSAIVHCVDLAVYVTLIYLVIFFTLLLSPLWRAAALSSPQASQGSSGWSGLCLWPQGQPEGERDHCRGQDLAGAEWGPDKVARLTSVKSSESHEFPDSCPQALGVEAGPAVRGRHSSSPHTEGHVLPRTHDGAESCRLPSITSCLFHHRVLCIC